MISIVPTKSKQKTNKVTGEYYDLKEALNLIGKKIYDEDFLFESHLGQRGVGEGYIRFVKTLRAADYLITEGFFEVIKDDGVLYKRGEDFSMIEPNGKAVCNFKIPKEQFDHVLKTRKRWIDKNPDPQNNGLIVEKQFNFTDIKYSWMARVGSKENLVSYFELLSIFKDKFKAEEWEIDIWLFLADPRELAALKNNKIDKDGHVYLYQHQVGNHDYIETFYHKEQLEKFTPQRFFEYKTLLENWLAKFDISEEKIIKSMSKHLSPTETEKLIPRQNFIEYIEYLSSIKAPLHKNNHTYFNCESVKKNPNFEERAEFIKNAVFTKSYIEAIEEKYRFPVLLSQQNKQLEVEEKKIKKIDNQKISQQEEIVFEMIYENEGLNHFKLKICDKEKDKIVFEKKMKKDSVHGSFIIKLCNSDETEFNPKNLNIGCRASQLPNKLGFKKEHQNLKSLFFEGTITDKKMVFYKKITKKRLQEKGLLGKI